MAQLQLRKAKRSMVWLKMAIAAPSGGGKTAGALLIAFGLMKEKYPELSDAELWDKVAVADTENGSGELYVNHEIGNFKIGVYNVIPMSAPFTAEEYMQAIELCEKNAIEVLVIDSTTHLWSGEGGLLQQQQIATKKTGNSYTAWRDITPLHNAFVEKMLQSKVHIIATIRSKQEYAQTQNEQGKKIVQKLGMEPEQRKGMEYEFTLVLDVDTDHMATSTKDRTSMFDGKMFKITPNTGETLMKWLLTADESPTEVRATSQPAARPANPETGIDAIKAEVMELCKLKGGSKNEKVMAAIAKQTDTGHPLKITDVSKLLALKEELLALESIKL
jgi:hypothetical protein